MVIKFEIPHSMSPSGGDVCFLTKAPANFYRAEMELQRRQDQKKVRHTGVTFRGNLNFKNEEKNRDKVQQNRKKTIRPDIKYRSIYDEIYTLYHRIFMFIL